MHQPSLAIGLLAFGSLVSSSLAQGLPPVPVPAGNPITPSKVLLGKALFFEEQVSASHTVACATCHDFARGGGSDARATQPGSVHPGPDAQFGTRDDIIGSRGVPGLLANGEFRPTAFGLADQVTGRRAMPAINAAYAVSLFWDGRASSTFRDPLTQAVVLNGNAALESQAVGPPNNDVEMGHFGQSWADVVGRVAQARPLALATNVPAALAQFVQNRSYPDLFQEVFGTRDITPARIAMAIATYERTLVSDQSAWDDFQRGVPGALTPQQDRGRQLFFNNVTECSDCHGGPLLAVNQFFYTGVTPQNEDLGRFAVTNNNNDRGRMRAPTLRNVALRAPYFHNGGARTLRDVVDFYARGGDFTAGNRDPRIRGFNMNNADRDALVAFLGAFTDPRVVAGVAPFDRPTLFTETRRGVAPYGHATAGSNNTVPSLVAVEPPHIGHGTFGLGLERAYGGAPAVLLLDSAPHTSGLRVLGADVFVALTPSMIFAPVMSAGSGAGQGTASQVLPIANVVGLRGLHIYGQWISLDPPTARLAATAAVDLTIF
ncbi:MAG: cytochrome c peroxidase [Planctomycetota bacterium]